MPGTQQALSTELSGHAGFSAWRDSISGIKFPDLSLGLFVVMVTVFGSCKCFL